MNQKGFAQVILIIGILIASGLIVSGSFIYKKNFSKINNSAQSSNDFIKKSYASIKESLDKNDFVNYRSSSVSIPKMGAYNTDWFNPKNQHKLELDTSEGGGYRCCEMPTYYVWVDKEESIFWIHTWAAGVGKIYDDSWYGPFKLAQSIDETTIPDSIGANWKTYTSKYIKATFRYPPDWNISEGEKAVYSVHLEKDPDLRMVVGACPGYSFSVSPFDRLVNYSVFSPVKKDIFKGESVEIYENTDQYGCYTKVIFINQFPIDSIKPKLVITLISKTTKPVIFDQILDTLKFN